MPVCEFQDAPSLFTDAEKHDPAKAITDIYTKAGLPAFYVQTPFTEAPTGTQFIGEAISEKYVSIGIIHAARKQEDDRKGPFLAAANAVVTPMLGTKGFDWEYWVHEVDQDLWKIHGLVPPQTGSDIEEGWARQNAPVRGRRPELSLLRRQSRVLSICVRARRSHCETQTK